MMQDEYGKQIEEYPVLPDEDALRTTGSTFSVQPAKEQKKKQKRHRDALLKYFCASSMAVMILPGLFGTAFFQFPMQHRLKEADAITAADEKETPVSRMPDTPPYQEPVLDHLHAEMPKESSSSGGTAVLRPAEEILVPNEEDPEPLVELVVCTECGGTGIHCEGDPTFGYDRGNGEGYPGCGGTGYSVCPDKWCNNGIRLCDNCMGSGTDQKNAEGICEICNGRGILDCEFCHNTGIAVCLTIDDHVECARCGGTGMMYPW